MPLRTAYREGVLLETDEPHERVNPWESIFQSGKKAVNSSIPKESQRTLPNPLDRFFENGGKPVPKSQPIVNQQQVQPKPQPQSKIRGRAPTAMTPEKAHKIAKYRDQQSKITIRERKHQIRLLETNNLLRGLIRVSARPIR